MLSVLKIGGSILNSPEAMLAFAQDFKAVHSFCDPCILVHGGGPAIGRELMALNLDFEFVNGVRKTTALMIPAVEKALWGVVNQELSNVLSHLGLVHQRLCGAKDAILEAEVLSPEMGYVGEVTRVHLRHLDSTVLLSPMGYDSKTGSFLNINADFAAQAVAVAMSAERLIFLSDQQGVLDSNKKLLKRLDKNTALKMIENQTIQGGMRVKVEQIFDALNFGVKQVVLLDGRDPHILSKYFLGNESLGTTFVT